MLGRTHECYDNLNFNQSLPKTKHYNCMLDLGLFSLAETIEHDNLLVLIQALVIHVEVNNLFLDSDPHLHLFKHYSIYCCMCQPCALAQQPYMGSWILLSNSSPRFRVILCSVGDFVVVCRIDFLLHVLQHLPFLIILMLTMTYTNSPKAWFLSPFSW
jgi:hypothetical protein